MPRINILICNSFCNTAIRKVQKEYSLKYSAFLSEIIGKVRNQFIVLCACLEGLVSALTT